MNLTPFHPLRGPTVVRGLIVGPARSRQVRLAVDTGATASLIHLPLLVDWGLDPERDGRRVQITTAGAVEFATSVPLTMLSILGQNKIGFSVVAHALPDDALLGLDFFRGHVLTLDFRAGSIALARRGGVTRPGPSPSGCRRSCAGAGSGIRRRRRGRRRPRA